MAITDLFSHKIHSNDSDWPDKLVELAALFSQFDGALFDRDAIETALMQISPRSAYAPRDASKFRDEISAYPSYLGLYRLEQSSGGWIVRLGETAKRYLLSEEPNVSAFLRLQLTLFQYPNGMGAAYKSYTNSLRIQANARDRTLEFVSNGVHLSPMRMMCKALAADSRLRSVPLLDSSITYEEVFALANSADVNRRALPTDADVEHALEEVRQGNLSPPARFERRFHTLRHTDIFDVGNGSLGFRNPLDDNDKGDLLSKIDAIVGTAIQYDGFDTAHSGKDLEAIVASGEWGRYFDAVCMLPARQEKVLGSDIVDSLSFVPAATPFVPGPASYELRERPETLPVPAAHDRRSELADPELTRIKRQRRNLEHKRLVGRVDELLRTLGASPMDNPHIDLYAEVPNDGCYLFEIKGEGESLLDQIRKGISQLYEYRYRYRDAVSPSTVLCLVLAKEPREIPWVSDYLCLDRDIAVCWFDMSGSLKCPDECRCHLEPLVPSAAA